MQPGGRNRERVWPRMMKKQEKMKFWLLVSDFSDGGCSEYLKLSYHKAVAYEELILIPLKLP